MTLEGARDTAARGAARFGNTWRVYQFIGWPADVYGATAKELPPDAHIIEEYPKASSTVAAAPVAEQGSLF